MTLLDKLTQQIENILEKQKLLESENEKLKQRLNILANADETIAKLELEKNQYEKSLNELISRLEKVLII